MKTFAEIVEDVKQLSLVGMQQLHELVERYVIEERRCEIRENAEAGLKEYRDGKLKSFSNVDELMDSLSDD